MSDENFGFRMTLSGSGSGAGKNKQRIHYIICVNNLGVVQGMITGIRGLCNGLGPALYGFIFYIFHVELKELPMTGTDLGTNTSPQHHFEQVIKIQFIWLG